MHVIKSITLQSPPEETALVVRHPALRRVALNTQEGLTLISWQDIVHCTADSNYARIYLGNGSSLLVSKTLAKVEAALPGRDFIRIHQSHLVNISSIRCVEKENVRLHCGTTLPVSRQGRKVLMHALSTISIQI